MDVWSWGVKMAKKAVSYLKRTIKLKVSGNIVFNGIACSGAKKQTRSQIWEIDFLLMFVFWAPFLKIKLATFQRQAKWG